MTLHTFHQFRQHTADDVSAALLTLAAALSPVKADERLTVKQAAERLNVSADTVYTLCKSGKLRHQRVGGNRGAIRIAPDDLQPTVKLRALL